jgi:hypothetical protein
MEKPSELGLTVLEIKGIMYRGINIVGQCTVKWRLFLKVKILRSPVMQVVRLNEEKRFPNKGDFYRF